MSYLPIILIGVQWRGFCTKLVYSIFKRSMKQIEKSFEGGAGKSIKSCSKMPFGPSGQEF